jgi:Kef-type K+ transport system membrane component KefB
LYPPVSVLNGTTEFELLVLMAVIVAGPIIAERFRIPGLVGLIAGGILVGPFVLGWVGPFSLVAELGAVGILYLMFLAGLEFSLRTFADNRRMAVVYGALGFIVPFSISIWVGRSWLGLGIVGASLIGAMWASNTLVAYPDVQAAGLRDNRAVGSAVAGGVIADLLSLTVLAIATSVVVLETADEETALPAAPEPFLPIWLALPLLAAVSLLVIPRIARWFFVKVGHSRVQRFTFSLAAMAGAAALATWGGVEGLIGAFLVGLGLNRLIPKSGTLFSRIEFVGSSIFIPAFLVSIGLSIDPRLLFDPATLVLAAVFTGLVVVGKLVAALIAGAIFRLKTPEIGIMATLSMGQAASTLAISQVGVQLGLFDETISNAAVLAIVAAVFITSYGTRFFIPKVERPTFVRPPIGDRVLVGTDDRRSELRIRLAGAIAAADQGVVVPFAVTKPDTAEVARAMVDDAASAAAALGHDVEGTLRFDDSAVEGTLQLCAEYDASVLLLPWPARAGDTLFGSELDRIGEGSPVPVLAAHLERPWDRVVVVTGDLRTDWKVEDSKLAIAVGRRAASTDALPLVLHTPSEAAARFVLRESDEIEVVIGDDSWAPIAAATGTDLVILPVHTLREAGALGPWRITGAVREKSVVVAGGPHRLAVSTRLARTPVHGLVADHP